MSNVLLEVKDLHTSFNVPSGEVRSVNGVSFTLHKGEVLGIVGESGSGKSVTAYSVMQILEKPGRVVGGSIKFKGQEMLGLPRKQLQRIRGEKISIIFQDSMSSLNPVWSIGNQLREVVKIHSNSPIVKEQREHIDELKLKIKNNEGAVDALKAELKDAKKKLDNFAHERSLEMLRLVGINEPEKRLKQYPFEFSGGMLQRIMIAMGLICEPDLIIADEPTTALDVTIQAQILELLLDLQKKTNVGIIIITHDLGVVAQVCHRVNVMYAGRIVETGTVEEIFYNPKHEYTKGLINSIPKMDKRTNRLEPIPGNPVDVFALPSGCSFAPRCNNCMKICLKKFPGFLQVKDDHYTACFKYLKDMEEAGKISEADANAYIDSCAEGNKAFSRLTRLDVEKAYQDYLAKKASYNEASGDKSLSEDEIDAAKFQMTDAKQEYHRCKRDFRFNLKERRSGGKEKFSIDKNDVHKKIKHHKVEINTNALKMTVEDLNKYVDHMSIATTQVNPDASLMMVKEAKAALLKAKKELMFAWNGLSRQQRVEALANIDNLEGAYLQSKRDLRWLNYVNKKYESTKKSLFNVYQRAQEKAQKAAEKEAANKEGGAE